MDDVPETTTSSLLNTQEPRHRGKIVKAPDRFMFLGQVIFDELDLNPSSYNESISHKDSRNWQSAMKVEDDVYMMELYNFKAKGQEHMVCKLHRSIFGLNQTSQS